MPEWLAVFLPFICIAGVLTLLVRLGGFPHTEREEENDA